MKTDKLQKVLIALDYNPTAQKVAETGFSLAKTMGAEVILLHVIADPVYYTSTEYDPIMGFTGYMDMGPFQLNSADGLKKASQHFLDKSIRTIVKEGEFADAILETAKELHADIIVVGSHSRKWLENILMGSVTEKVLHHTPIPLLIVPTKKSN